MDHIPGNPRDYTLEGRRCTHNLVAHMLPRRKPQGLDRSHLTYKVGNTEGILEYHHPDYILVGFLYIYS